VEEEDLLPMTKIIRVQDKYNKLGKQTTKV
jgi:hypothetical protein